MDYQLKISKIIFLAFLSMCTAYTVLAADENIGLTIRSDGQNIPIAVSTTATSKLRIYKNGTVYYIQLVNTGDPLATKMRVNVPGVGKKALKKYVTYLDFACVMSGNKCYDAKILTQNVNCAYASVNNGRWYLIGCGRWGPAGTVGTPTNPKKTDTSLIGLSSGACNVMRIGMTVGRVPTSANESFPYASPPSFTVTTYGTRTSWIHNATKEGENYYRMGFDDNGDGQWQNLYFTINTDTTHDYNVNNLSSLTSCTP
ncbi:MAG: hypothetical protein WC412_04260 [Candidatus Omnitrophota bacterium]|jgi:hypothetical protein